MEEGNKRQKRVPTMCCGENFCLLLKLEAKKTSLWCWGSNDHGQLGHQHKLDKSGGEISLPGVSSNATHQAIACGGKHTLVIAGQTIYSFGDRTQGQLGHSKPFGMVRLPKTPGSSTIEQVEYISSYGDCSCAIGLHGKNLYAWGMGQAGALGITQFTMQPILFGLPDVALSMSVSKQKAIQVAVGAQHTLVLTEDGNVFSWGSGKNGRLGHGDLKNQREPRRLEAFVGGTGQQIVQIASGEAHSMALDENGQVYSWGSGSYGRLGLGGEGDRQSPAKISALSNVKTTWISCSEEHSLAVTKMYDGVSLFTWGGGRHGKLGIGKVQSQVSLPEPVYAFYDLKLQVIEAVCGPKMTLCKLITSSEGTSSFEGKKIGGEKKIELYAFGKVGFLFDESDRYVAWTPRKIDHEYTSIKEQVMLGELNNKTEEEFKAKAWRVQAGDRHALALSQENVLISWGENSHGQLGVGSVRVAISPMKVQLKQQVSNIACGSLHSLALANGNLLFSWGCGSHGQLGLNDTKNRNYPCLVQTLQGSTVKRIAAGGYHSAAILGSDSEDVQEPQVAIWGSNEFGQLGTGNKLGNHKLLPFTISNKAYRVAKTNKHIKPSDFEIALGFNYTMILAIVRGEEDETYLFVAGENTACQLGLGQRSTAGNTLEHLDSWEEYPKVDSGPLSHRSEYPLITKIAAGRYMSAAIVEGNELYVWGETTGLGRKRLNRPTKKLLNEHMPQARQQGKLGPAGIHSFVYEDIDIGTDHALAIVKVDKNLRLLLSWGISSYGRLGIGNISKTQTNMGEGDEEADDHEEKKQQNIKEMPPSQVSVKNLENKPHVIDSFYKSDSVACGNRQSFAINSKSGHVFAWGHAARGKLGIGTDDAVCITEPTELPAFNYAHPEEEGIRSPTEAKDNQMYASGLTDTKHEPRKVSKNEKEKKSLVDDISQKSFVDHENKIDELHAEYEKGFIKMISNFDEIERGICRAKIAIHERLRNQGLHKDKKLNEWDVCTPGLNPVEQVLGRMYLEPMIPFHLFKHLHSVVKQAREKKATETKNEGVFKIAPKKKDDENNVWRNDVFCDFIFTLYDLNEEIDTRLFQAFFRLCVEYVLEPTLGGETQPKDLIREDMPLWHIFSTALATGTSRLEIANTFCDLLSDHRLYHDLGHEFSKDPAIEAFAMKEDKKSEKKDWKQSYTPLKKLAKEVIKLMTQGVSEKKSLANRLEQASLWLLDIVFLAIEDRALKYEQSVKAYSKTHHSDGSAKNLDFRDLVRRRFCIALMKAQVQIAIDTTHYRRTWAAFKEQVVDYQDAEMFVLHALRSRRALQNFFSIRKEEVRIFVPKGCNQEMIERPTYHVDNARPYAKLPTQTMLKKFAETHLDGPEDEEKHGGPYESDFAGAEYHFGSSSAGAQKRRLTWETRLKEDLILLRSMATIRRVSLDWKMQNLLLDSCKITTTLQRIIDSKKLQITQAHTLFRIVPFYIERQRKISKDPLTGVWAPQNIDDVVDNNQIPEKSMKLAMVHREAAQGEKKEPKRKQRGHRISVQDCIVMYKILRDEACINIMRTKTGEAAWKGLINLLRSETERLRESPSLKGQYEKTKNNLLIIRDTDSKTPVILGDSDSSASAATILDPSLLFIRLKEISNSQHEKLKILQNNFKIYRNTVAMLHNMTGTAYKVIQELAQTFISTTGPHEEDSNTASINRHIRRRGEWTTINKVDGNGMAFKQNPTYFPVKLHVTSRKGGMHWKAYNQLVNKDGVSDLVAFCFCYQFQYRFDESMLRRAIGDPTDTCCFCLACPSMVLGLSAKRNLAVFLKNASFVFIPTSVPHVFNVKLLVYRNNEQQILLHCLVSVHELERHLCNLDGKAEEIKDAQPEAENEEFQKPCDDIALQTTRQLNFVEIQSNNITRYTLDTTLDPRPSTVHKKWVHQRQHHLYNGFLYILFDPLGTTVNVPQTVPFTFNVVKLIEFLKTNFPPVPTGFLDRLEPLGKLRHKEILTLSLSNKEV